MPKLSLTDATVRSLTPPLKGQEIHWDTDLSGFGLRLSQGGSKTWILVDPRSRVRAKETIGRYPLVSLKIARSEAKRRLAEYTLGKSKPSSMGWNDAKDEFLLHVQKTCRARTHEDYTRILAKLKFQTTPLREITWPQIKKKLQPWEGSEAEHTHCLVVLRAFFNWCFRQNYLDQSPLARVQIGQYNERERVLTDDEIKKIWKACEGKYGRIVKQILLFGQRRTEVSSYKPSWKEGDLITFPSELCKNHKEHTFPVGILGASLLGDNSWQGWSKSKAQLDERAGVSGWTLHDLRRTLRTKWAEIGISPELAERYINHISRSKLDRIYNRHHYIPEMRLAVQKWEDWLQTILKS